MSFHSWLQYFRFALAAPSRGRRSLARSAADGLRAATHRLNLEVLENRLTPSFTYFGDYPAEEFYQMTGPDFASTYDSATVDFNGDGWLDLFTMTSPEDPYVLGFVYLNRRDGTFELEGSGYAGGFDFDYPYWIAIGDFNVPYGIGGDGHTDLAILHWPDAVTIYRNNGDWGPYLFVSGATVTEGNAGTQAATFTVTLNPAGTQTITVDYATRDGDATADPPQADYKAASGTLTFAPGETSKTITVLVNGDRLPETNEAFYADLSNPTNADVKTGWGVGVATIVDDEPRISINDATVAEGNAGAAAATFTVMLSAPSTQTITVGYATADGSATAGPPHADYQAASGTLTFTPGETSKSFTVAVKGDRLGEPTETFAVNLSAPTNATIVDGLGIGAILDNEPRISIVDVTKREGKKGNTTLFTFTVRLSAAYDQPVTVNYATANGTAKTSDNDYVAKTGTLTFAPGEKSKTITVSVRGDRKREAHETFFVRLANAVNSYLEDDEALATILNDD